MPALRPFEMDAIRRMAEGHLPSPLLQDVLASETIDRYEYTGCGYFLSVRHPQLPAADACLAEPAVMGIAGKIHAGFVVYLGGHRLTLECHTWGAIDVPANFRDLPVEIRVAGDLDA